MSIKLSKVVLVCAVIATLGAVSGCVATQPLVINQSIGPARVTSTEEGRPGQLVVYSSWDRFDTLNAGHRKHTPYAIRAQAGGTIVHVNNRRGSFGEEPETVALSPGKYLVDARATNVGALQVPVVIRTGETTVVYLDGVTAPSASWQQETNWVRQPNGLIVGWGDTVSSR